MTSVNYVFPRIFFATHALFGTTASSGSWEKLLLPLGLQPSALMGLFLFLLQSEIHLWLFQAGTL